MFNLLKKKTNKNIYAPVDGKCIDITEVRDIAFSSKTMGDGIAFIPTNDTVVAPCDGTVKMIFRTGHAFGLETDNGLEILIHIGIDTVNLAGNGFDILSSVGINKKVKKGEPIIRFDLNTIKEEYDITTIMVITNGKRINKCSIGKVIQKGDIVLEGE